MAETTHTLKPGGVWPALLLVMLIGGCAAPGAAPGPQTRKAGTVAPTPAPETPAGTARPVSPAASLIDEAAELESRGAVNEAGSVLERAVRLDPSSGEAWLELARLRARSGDSEGAHNLALRALNVSSDEPGTARSARAFIKQLERSGR